MIRYRYRYQNGVNFGSHLRVRAMAVPFDVRIDRRGGSNSEVDAAAAWLFPSFFHPFLRFTHLVAALPHLSFLGTYNFGAWLLKKPFGSKVCADLLQKDKESTRAGNQACLKRDQ